MNDLKDLLELALTGSHDPGPDQTVDPAGDLARGRSLLRRRRLMVLAGATAAVAAVALLPLAMNAAGGSPAHSPQAPPASSMPPATSTSPSHPIALVAYEGQQPPGYEVAEMPAGWVVQGSGPYALVIAPADDKDTNPDAFIGKLVVMLQSRDAPVPTGGTSLPVNGRPGILQVSDNTQSLTFQGAGGRWIVVQAPTSLGWDGPQLARFAAGVQVLVNAQPGRG
jgi:hypothetical protein